MAAVTARNSSRISGRMLKTAAAIRCARDPDSFIFYSASARHNQTAVSAHSHCSVVIAQLVLGSRKLIRGRIIGKNAGAVSNQHDLAGAGNGRTHDVGADAGVQLAPAAAKIACQLGMAAQPVSQNLTPDGHQTKHGAGIGKTETFPALAGVLAAKAVATLGSNHQTLAVNGHQRVEMALQKLVAAAVKVGRRVIKIVVLFQAIVVILDRKSTRL